MKNQNDPVNQDLNHSPFIKDSYQFYMRDRGYPGFFDPANWTKNNTAQDLKDKVKLMRKVNQGVQREEKWQGTLEGEKERRVITHDLGVQPRYFYARAEGKSTVNSISRIRFDKKKAYVHVRDREIIAFRMKVVY